MNNFLETYAVISFKDFQFYNEFLSLNDDSERRFFLESSSFEYTLNIFQAYSIISLEALLICEFPNKFFYIKCFGDFSL